MLQVHAWLSFHLEGLLFVCQSPVIYLDPKDLEAEIEVAPGLQRANNCSQRFFMEAVDGALTVFVLR